MPYPETNQQAGEQFNCHTIGSTCWSSNQSVGPTQSKTSAAAAFVGIVQLPSRPNRNVTTLFRAWINESLTDPGEADVAVVDEHMSKSQRAVALVCGHIVESQEYIDQHCFLPLKVSWLLLLTCS